MKKLLFALMLALGLAFTPISIKAEEPTEEPPVAETETPTEEPKEDAPEETPEEETITIETGKDRTKIKLRRSAVRSVDVYAAEKRGESKKPAAKENKDSTEAE